MTKNCKMKLLGLCSALVLSLSGCATLTDGLKQVNDTLGQINGTSTGISSARSGKSIPDKITAIYELKNVRLSENDRGTAVEFLEFELTGEAYNKSSSDIKEYMSMPAYHAKEMYVNPIVVETYITAKEKTKIYSNGFIKKENRVDTSKIRFTLEKN